VVERSFSRNPHSQDCNQVEFGKAGYIVGDGVTERTAGVGDIVVFGAVAPDKAVFVVVVQGSDD